MEVQPLIDLANIVKEQSKEKDVMATRTRQQGDELDEYKQKNLRGKFVITSTANKPSDVKKKDDLGAAGGDIALPGHIVALVKTKFGVIMAEQDIGSSHYLPKGGIFFSLWNMRPGSVCDKLTTEIKSAKNRNINIYINFMLTKKRSELLFEVRKLKRDGSIARFYSDEKGDISIKVNSTDKNKKLTFHHQKTYTVEELKETVAELLVNQ